MEHTLLSTTTITEQLEHIEESLFTAIFIGCHADDLEIGAGGTIARMVESGWNIWACILTAEADPAVAHRRQQEQIAASELLGLDPKKIFFMNFPDGNLQCSRETVTALRMALEERGCYPELVFTHTHADSHNDHRAAHDITRSTFRKKPILTYAVVNSLIHSDFKPKIFVDTTKYNEKKHISCSVYESQGPRIMHKEMDYLTHGFGSPLGLDHAEGFELILQEGAEDMVYLALSLNDDSFHNFWYPLIGSQNLNIIRSTLIRRIRSKYHWPEYKELEGMNLLLKSFSEIWHDRNPVEIHSCSEPQSEHSLFDSNVLLSGSGAANTLVRNHFDHFENLRYYVNYTMPDYQNLHIIDRQTKKKITATYQTDDFGSTRLVKDIGIITVMHNPMRETKHLIGCMGIHGFGTLGCYAILSQPEHLRELLKLVDVPLKGKGFQILVEYNTATSKACLKPKSLHKF